MKTKLAAVAATAILLAACASSGKEEMAKQNMAHVHIGHVTTSWKDTPDKQGLLPTAIAEAKIVQTHVGLALQKPDDLAWMKMHTAHVQHAIDPTLVAKGPGWAMALSRRPPAPHSTSGSPPRAAARAITSSCTQATSPPAPATSENGPARSLR